MNEVDLKSLTDLEAVFADRIANFETDLANTYRVYAGDIFREITELPIPDGSMVDLELLPRPAHQAWSPTPCPLTAIFVGSKLSDG